MIRTVPGWMALLAVGVSAIRCATAGGEDLSAEQYLPLHGGRDAYTPAAARLKDATLVIWQSGHLAPGDLREGFNFDASIVGCRVGADGSPRDAAPFVIAKADDLRERPDLAANGEIALAVWHDLRNGRDWDVYAARVTAAGKVLDPGGFLVAGGAHNQANPRVAWDGKRFVVVWQDFRDGERYEIYAARIGTEGRTPDAEAIRLSSLSTGVDAYDPAIASRGGGQSVVYWVQGGSKHVPAARAVLLGDEGAATLLEAMRDGTGRVHKSPGNGYTPIFIAAGKSTFLVAWRTNIQVGRTKPDSDTNAALFDDTFKERLGLLALGGRRHWILNASLGWDGDAYAAAWTEYRAEKARGLEQEQVFVSRVSEKGELVGPARHVAGSSAAPAMNPTVACEGQGVTLVAYEQHPETADTPVRIAVRRLNAK